MKSICPLACLLNVFFAKLSNKASHSFFCKPNWINSTACSVVCPILVSQTVSLSGQQNSVEEGQFSQRVHFLVTFTVLQHMISTKWKILQRLYF